MIEFDRPIFILAPPRSGSTLLFETLSRNAALWSLGDEGHGIIERHEALRPRPFSDDSNRLLANDCSAALAATIQQDFRQLIHNREGRALAATDGGAVRLLEKTPKNVLRIPFLLQLFPDARFIYLYRDARDNISSIIDGWRSGRFITYKDKQTRHGLWSFLLPPDWRSHTEDELAAIATFQWAACHEYVMKDLSTLEPTRWCAVNYSEFLGHTETVVQRLCDFMDVPMDDELRQHCRGRLPPSRFTLSPPATDKWRRHARDLTAHMPTASAVVTRINEFTASHSTPLSTQLDIDLTKVPAAAKIGRNQPCPCGSGKKYKHCHGKV